MRDQRLCHVCFTYDPGVPSGLYQRAPCSMLIPSSVWIHLNTDSLTSLFLAFGQNTVDLKPTAESPKLKTQMRVEKMSDKEALGAEMWILSASVFQNSVEQAIIKQYALLWLPPGNQMSNFALYLRHFKGEACLKVWSAPSKELVQLLNILRKMCVQNITYVCIYDATWDPNASGYTKKFNKNLNNLQAKEGSIHPQTTEKPKWKNFPTPKSY